MKSVYLLFLIIFCCDLAIAQSPCNEDINSSGAYYEHPSGINNTWSVGSPIVGEMLSEDSTFLICNGFVPLPCSFGPLDPCANSEGSNEQQPSPIMACAGETVNLTAPSGYSYVWEDGTQASNFNVTDAGSYQVTITDVCEQILTYEVTYLPLPTISFQTSNPTDCAANNGMISLSFTGIDDGVYNLTYKGGEFNNVTVSNGSATITGLTPGLYNFITISNAAGCSATSNGLIEIEESGNIVSPPVLNTSSSFCESNNVESISVTGASFANFTWYSDAALTNLLSRGAYYLSNGSNETVYVTQQVAGACESAALEVNIIFNSLEILTSKSYEVCANEIDANEATIDLTIYETELGGENGTWKDENGNTVQANSYQLVDQANLQYVLINENGCSATASVKFKVSTVNSKTIEIARCTFENGNLINLMAIATVNALPENGVWISNEMEIDASDFYLLFEPLQTFNYNYTDENSCANRLTANVTLEQAPQMQAKVICSGNSSFEEYYIEVVLTKNVTYNNVIVSDGNTSETASGSGVITFGPYTHSTTGLNSTVLEAYFAGTVGCTMTIEVLESYCPNLEPCNCANSTNAGNILGLDEPAGFTANGFIPYYVLSNESGSILSHNNTSLFEGLENNNYQVHTILVNPLDGEALANALSAESSISTFTQSTPFMNLEYSVNEPKAYTVNCDCTTATCTEISALEISDKVCEGNSFDVSFESTEANAGIMIAYYNGIVALPDPYNNPPDGLFNNGNAVNPQDGVVNLTNVGANLTNGFQTIVAYLANPTDDCRPMIRKFTEIYEAPQLNLVAEPICAGNTGVLLSNISGGAFPYNILWTDPAGQNYSVQNFTVHLASADNAGAYTVSVTDAKGCTISSSVELEVIDQENTSFVQVSVCEEVAGGALEANINLNEYEALMNATGGVWRNPSGNIVSNTVDVQLAGASQYRFVYLIESQGNCNYEQVLIVTIKSGIQCQNLGTIKDKDIQFIPVVPEDDRYEYELMKREAELFELAFLLPNPTSGQLYFGIQMPTNGAFTYEIYDVTGKMLSQTQQAANKGFIAFELDVSMYTNGMYLLKINYDDHYVHQKFIKQ